VVSGQTPRPGSHVNLPLYSLLTAGFLVALAVIALIFVKADNNTTPVLISIVGLIATTVPSLIAAAYAERTNRDIRNGVVEEKVKSATKEALVEHQVVTRDGPFVGASTQALLDLLAQRHGTQTTADPAHLSDPPGVD
jgi:uncharacterized membrane protein